MLIDPNRLYWALFILEADLGPLQHLILSCNCNILLIDFDYFLSRSVVDFVKRILDLRLYTVIHTVIDSDSSFVICYFHIFTVVNSGYFLLSIAAIFVFTFSQGNAYLFCTCARLSSWFQVIFLSWRKFLKTDVWC